MRQPTPKQFSDWYEKQPRKGLICTDCGFSGKDWEIQPQHPFYAEGKEGTALCFRCIARRNEAYKVERKKQLDAMPRCEVDGCNRRGALHVGWGYDKALMCRAHFLKANQTFQANFAGVFWMPGPSLSKQGILDLVKG